MVVDIKSEGKCLSLLANLQTYFKTRSKIGIKMINLTQGVGINALDKLFFFVTSVSSHLYIFQSWNTQ